MRITKEQAKELSIKVWQWLYDNPTKIKPELPKELWEEIMGMEASCPLCQYFLTKSGNVNCKKKHEKCPLMVKGYPNGYCSYWRKWAFSSEEGKRKDAAKKILDRIIAWEI